MYSSLDGGPWTCFDEADKLKKNRTHYQCEYIGMFRHPDVYSFLKMTIEEFDNKDLHAFQWNDELSYSAAKFVDQFYGCTVNPDLVAFDGNDHEFLREVATFQNHIRLSFVPSNYPWSSPKEAVFDWILDDDTNGHQKRLHLISNTFD